MKFLRLFFLICLLIPSAFQMICAQNDCFSASQNRFNAVVTDSEHPSSRKSDPSKSIWLSPNPNENTLEITFKEKDFLDKIKKIKVIDSSGREHFMPCDLNNSKVILEISSLRGGVYFVLIETRIGDFLKKFMKV